MKLKLKNTINGLIPLYDNDYDEKRKLKIGEIYTAEIKQVRNPLLLAKYFKMLHCAFDLRSHKQREIYQDGKAGFEAFRKAIQITAGYFEQIWLPHKGFVEQGISIAYENMSESDFRDLYEKTHYVVMNTFLRHITIDDFEKHMINF
jgi:hypothetical protein